MKARPNFGPWHKDPDAPSPVPLTDEEKAAINKKIVESIRGLITKWDKTGLLDGLKIDIDKSNMAVLCYSPPFPPMDEEDHKMWSALLSAGIVEVQIVQENGVLGFTVHRNQTITLEKGKFYPLVPYGGEVQQEAAGKLKDCRLGYDEV